MTLSPFAGKPAPAELLVDIPRLVTAYYTGQPDASVATSGAGSATAASMVAPVLIMSSTMNTTSINTTKN